MKREFLSGLGLEKDVMDQIMAEHGKTVQDNKAKLSETEGKVTSLTEQLATRDKDIEKLKDVAGTNKELQTQLTDLQGKYNNDKAEYETKLLQTKKNSAIELALASAKARNTTAVKALLDAEKIEFGEEGVKGLDEQLQTIQKDNPFLFEVEDVKPNPTPQIVTGGNPSDVSGSEEKGWREALKENYQNIKR